MIWVDKKIVAINELLVVARRRYHKKKETFYLEIKKLLETRGESDAMAHLKRMQGVYATRADVEAYEMKEAFQEIKKVLQS